MRKSDHYLKVQSPIKRAIIFARDRHEESKKPFRNNGEPYINHVYGTAANVIKYHSIIYDQPAPEELIVAAWLHDLIEDTKTTLEEIEYLFGKKVRILVEEVTNNKFLREQIESGDVTLNLFDVFDNNVRVEELSKEIESNTIIANKIGKILSQYHELLNISNEGLFLKMCDRLDNLSDLFFQNDRFRKRALIETEILFKYVLENKSDINYGEIKMIQVLREKILQIEKRADELNNADPMLEAIYERRILLERTCK